MRTFIAALIAIGAIAVKINVEEGTEDNRGTSTGNLPQRFIDRPVLVCSARCHLSLQGLGQNPQNLNHRQGSRCFALRAVHRVKRLWRTSL